MGLEDGREEADEGFEGLFFGGAVAPFGESDFAAGFEVIEEDVAHLAVDIPGVDHEVTFEVVFETAEIEVDRAGGDDVVVDNHGLCMQHAGKKEVDFYSCLEAVCDVGAAPVAEHHAVGLFGNHDADVDS